MSANPSRAPWTRWVFIATALALLVLVVWWNIFFFRQSNRIKELEQLRHFNEAQHVAMILQVTPGDPAALLKKLSANSYIQISSDADVPKRMPIPRSLFDQYPTGAVNFSLGPAHPGQWLFLSLDCEIELISDKTKKIIMMASESGVMALLILLGVWMIYRTSEEQRRLSTSMDFFIGAVNHELKTPLTSVRLLLETMAKDPSILKNPGTLVQRGLADIDRLKQMVDVILLANRLAQGPISAPLSPVDLGESVRLFAERAAPLIEHQKARLDTEIAAAPARAEPELLQRILDNLLDNAVKYSDGPAVIRVRTSTNGRESVIEFSDQGMGLTPEEQRQVFDRFWRSERAASRRGVGLGLYVCQMIAQSLGGTLEARSEGPGRGTIFRLALPAAPPAASPTEAA